MKDKNSLEPVAPTRRAGAEILRDIDEQPVRIDGTTMSKREAQLRLLYARALNGSSKASQQLQRVRDRVGTESLSQKVGYLLVPEPPTLEEWIELVYDQQAPFRETRLPGEEA